MMEVLGPEDIVRFIKAARLTWIRHVERMCKERLKEKVINSQIIS